MSLTFLTIDDVAEMLRLSRDTVYRLVQSGQLPGKKIGRAWRFAAEEIESHVAKDFRDGEQARQVRAAFSAREEELVNTIRERNEELDRINRKLEAEVRERQHAETHLRAVFESVADGLIVADENHRMVLFNKAAEEILGMGITEGDPESWPEIYGIYMSDGETPCPAIELPLVRAVQGERVDHVELIIRNAYLSEPAWIACRATPITDNTGVLKGGVVVFHDVTASKRAEEEFHLSEQRLKNLLDCLPQVAQAIALESRSLPPQPGAAVL
ncbi:MAG: helix-turn-helix domain-containing protein [Planctomycetaceae bacterium]|nr:helix-turn-helix domain-containing protein [Planctomycetales bacterium]MCB9923935.1 helix-turn-helix domain-containing protein [Planctomycetaceae bacterium]